ncbi:hypothetical protein MKD41_14190 [Lutibacter sp. A64]|uniref:hypothetical protein n=1 Tax=Lutibacter sp. A64 TaxID=2918526 RepID=UPI001F05C4FC|nr:hypothetical protein [Lutibacter sp. A64]UMB53473.1 hypothetical protein MKD41_14190 [Lutibacter sp. A64]
MFSNKFYLLILFFITYNICFSQETKVVFKDSLLPKSIYSKDILNDKYSTFITNNKLNLKQYKLLFVDINNIENGYFSIPLKNINKASDFVFETFKDLQNKRDLEQSFFDVSKLYLPRNPKK